MKLLYLLFCYLLVLFVIHGIIVDQSSMLTIYHRTQIPLMVIMSYYIINNYRKLPTNIKNKYIIPVVSIILLILSGSIFHENLNILHEFSGFVFFLLFGLFCFISGFNNPDYLDRYNNKMFWAFVFLVGIGIILEIKAITLFNLTRDSTIRPYSYNSAPFTIAYCIPLILFFKRASSNVITIVLLLVLILSTKRGPIVGIVGSYLIYIAFFERKLKSVAKYILLFTLLGGVIAEIIPEEFRFVLDRFNPENSDDMDITSHRLDIWDIYTDYYINGDVVNQLFGFGTDSYVLNIVERIVGQQYTPHNSYIMICFYYGLLSFIGYVIFLWKISLLLKDERRDNPLIKPYALYVFMLLICSFYTPGFADSSYMSLIVFYMLGVLGGAMLSFRYCHNNKYED